jgi:GT2 family glycosyltransferase
VTKSAPLGPNGFPDTDIAAAGLTIVVLTRNRRELLRGCLESLFIQDDPGVPLRFLVVDDGSTDGTGEMARGLLVSRPQWQYVPQAHAGIAAARNTGIRNSRSALIAIVADDYLLPTNYARAIAFFFRDHPLAQVLRFKVVPAGGGVFRQALHAYQEASVVLRLVPQASRGRRRDLWRRDRAEETVTTDHDLEAAGAAAFRSDVFRRIGSFNESFVRGEDTEFTRRLRAAGIPVHYSPHLHIRHRHDPGLGSALKNAFISGRASWWLCAAPEHNPARGAFLIPLALRSCPAALYWSCWRAWQTGWPARFFVYWPVMMLLEASSRAGFFYAASSRARSREDALPAALQLEKVRNRIAGPPGARPTTEVRPAPRVKEGGLKAVWRTFQAWQRQIPSRKAFPGAGPGRRIRLLATVMVRDEMRFLPGMLRNVAPHVDGIIALDDGSSDGSDRLLAESPQVLELLRNPADRPVWDEPGNHRHLVEAALRHGAEWIIALDADERLEREFRARAERVIQRSRSIGLTAFGIHFRELWDSPRSFRVDGIWGRKTQPRFFRALADHQFDERPIHGAKAPLQGKIRGSFPIADLIIYHLRMVQRPDREARRLRNERFDPQARYQPGIGYAYLTDESGLRLRPVPRRRGYEE